MKGFKRGDLVVYIGKQPRGYYSYRDGNPREVIDVSQRGSVLLSDYPDYLVEEVFELYQPSLENK